MTPSPSEDQTLGDVVRTFRLLFQPSDVVEIRALNVGCNQEHTGSTRAGYFDVGNTTGITKAVKAVDGRSEGVYFTLNRINPELLARSNNVLKPKLRSTTSDADILERRWLYVDADPIRPAGISSTDDEHKAALQRVTEVQQYLDECGWPKPIVADSGNGAHLLYRLPLIELGRSGDLVKRCLRALSTRFSDSTIKVDESTANPSRICKLYGTMTRKGDSLPARPHRRSRFVNVPERIDAVPSDCLEALASEASLHERKPHVVTSLPNFDVNGLLRNSAIEVIKGPEPYCDGHKWTLARCPFNPMHAKPILIQFASGVVLYKCLHNSCSENGWAKLCHLIQPEERQSCGSDLSGGLAPRITSLSQIPSVFGLESKLHWRVDGMVAQGSVTMICAESGTGKTWFGYYLAGSVANNAPVLGHAVFGCKALYLDGENPLYVAKQRLKDLGIRDCPDLTMWGGWNTSPPRGPDDPLIVEFAKEHKGLIVYDSLIEFHPGSEQSSTETRSFMRHFRRLANAGASVVILHHSGKAETAKLYRGSSDIKAAVDTAYALTRTGQESGQIGDLSLTCFKGRLAPGQNFGMRFKKGVGFLATSGEEGRVLTVKQTITQILAEAPNCNQSAVVERAKARGVAKGQVEACLKSGDWTKTSGPNNSILYSLETEEVDDYASAN